MSQDPYDVLGVSRNASADDVRRAYRSLAKRLHPDLNPGDTQAAGRFKEVSAAYELLRDPEKRARYDRGEIDATGTERPQQRFYRDYADTAGARPYHSAAGYEDIADVSDLFADLFGERAKRRRTIRRKGQDATYRLEVDFLDAARGAKRRITLPHGGVLEVAIPEGVADGETLRLKGKGRLGLGGGPPGDALIELSVRPHPVFERRGDDVLVDLPIGIDEAVLGGRIEVPTVWGRVALTVPKGSSSGQVLRIRGKGVKRAQGQGRGDQLVRLRIVLPETVDQELEDFMKRWRERHRYHPREGARAKTWI